MSESETLRAEAEAIIHDRRKWRGGEAEQLLRLAQGYLAVLRRLEAAGAAGAAGVSGDSEGK